MLPAVAAEAKQHGFNYPEKIFTRWRGRHFYVGVTYRDGRGGEPFDVLTTRLEYVGGGSFQVSYRRHTDQCARSSMR